MARSCIEVHPGDTVHNSDPLTQFVSLLEDKHNSSKEITEYNLKLLNNLVQKRKIQKSSIIWHHDTIAKIYGFRVDDNGKIEYDVGSYSPERKTKQYVSSSSKINMSAVRNAIIRSKQQSIAHTT